MTVTVHPSAIIDEGATIGAGTKVWHWSHISSGAVIGSACSFGQNVYVANDVSIGNRVKVQNNVSVFDGVVLEDDVFCGPSVVFTNVINPRSHQPRKNEYKKTHILTGASLGANATVVCGNTVGRYAMIGAGAVVTENVPNFALMVGVPAYQLGWVCACGVGLPKEAGKHACSACGARYQITDTHCRPEQQ
ncbi:MAG: N-acetyltransferase [Burkholderiaceae bacterium]